MNFNQYKLLLLFAFFTGVIQSQKLVYTGDPDKSFFNARDIAFAGDRVAARDTLKLILTKYPDYFDVRNLLAKTYSWDGDYELARKHFNKIISKEKNLKEVWVAAINNEFYAENYYIALGLSSKALKFVKDDADLIALQENAKTEVN